MILSPLASFSQSMSPQELLLSPFRTDFIIFDIIILYIVGIHYVQLYALCSGHP